MLNNLVRCICTKVYTHKKDNVFTGYAYIYINTHINIYIYGVRLQKNLYHTVNREHTKPAISKS